MLCVVCCINTVQSIRVPRCEGSDLKWIRYIGKAVYWLEIRIKEGLRQS